jgi:hypothetical protein
MWSGVYGAGYDLGSSGGIGLRASAVTADKRNHGKILMSQSQVDDWCDEYAQRFFVQTSSSTFSPIPREARGVPHYAVPGLHTYLDDLVQALESTRSDLGIESHQTVDSLQALPFGPYSERIRPHVLSAVDPTTLRLQRNPQDQCVRNRAYLSDSTTESTSVFREPLVAACSVTAPEDNVYAQSHPFVSTAFGAIATIAVHAKTAFTLASARNPGASTSLNSESPSASSATQMVRHLHECLKAFHELPENAPSPFFGAGFLCACVCSLLTLVYPASVAMAELATVPAYALAPAAFAKRMRAPPPKARPPPDGDAPTAPQQQQQQQLCVGFSLASVVTCDVELKRARDYFAPFLRTDASKSAWTAVARVLELLIVADGTYDNTLKSLDALASANEALLRNIWKVNSPDGILPPQSPHAAPAICRLQSPRHVCKGLFSPVLFSQVTDPVTNFFESPRSSFVGVMPMALQQVMQLLIGAAKFETLQCSYVQNFGYLVYRPSAAADVLTFEGNERSSKAISCMGVEGDELLFGERKEKLAMCRLHRIAWEKNLHAIRPLCMNISAPMPDEVRSRGDDASVAYIKKSRKDLRKMQRKSAQELSAERFFDFAVSNLPHSKPGSKHRTPP